jgi:hypothetical protein
MKFHQFVFPFFGLRKGRDVPTTKKLLAGKKTAEKKRPRANKKPKSLNCFMEFDFWFLHNSLLQREKKKRKKVNGKKPDDPHDVRFFQIFVKRVVFLSDDDGETFLFQSLHGLVPKKLRLAPMPSIPWKKKIHDAHEGSLQKKKTYNPHPE